MAKTITTDLVTLSTLDALTGWSNDGQWQTNPALNEDVLIQGINCSVQRVTAYSSGPWAAYMGYITSPINFADGTMHLKQWIRCISAPAMATKALGGIRAFCSSDTAINIIGAGAKDPGQGPDKSKLYYVGGSDTDLVLGWTNYTWSPRGHDSTTIGSYDASNVRIAGFGARCNGIISNKTTNMFADALRYGSKIVSVGGDATNRITIDDVYAADSTLPNSWGIVTKGVAAFRFSAKFVIGKSDQTVVTYYQDKGKTFSFRNFPVDDNWYELSINQSSSYPTSVKFGEEGNGVGGLPEYTYDGCVFQSEVSSGSYYTWTLNVNGDATAEFLDCRFTNMHHATLNRNTELSYCEFMDCGIIDANDATIEYTRFGHITTSSPINADCALKIDNTGEMLKINTCSFLGNTYAIKITSPGVYTFNDHHFSGNTYDIVNASGGDVTINCLLYSNPSTYINTSGGTTTIKHMRSLTLTGIEQTSQGATVALYEHDTTNELAVAFDVTTGNYSYTYNYLPNTYIDIVVISLGYIYERIDGFLLPSADTSIPIEQILDRQYNNPPGP